MPELTILSVAQINRYISSKFKADENLANVLIKGEISNFTNHIKSGHWYFTLKDQTSSIKAIMFKWANQAVPFELEDGMSVIVSGSVQVYEVGGNYQIYVNEIIPDGVGALNIAYEQLKAKLEAEGLFSEEHKRQLNPLPQKICVITAPDGAALQDVLNILSRRYPVATVTVVPTLVQGKDAPRQICSAIRLANTTDADTIILCRGGGSIEDLWAFNDESVARQVYASKIPIISAVGHETDFTICDFTADLRAPTPSAAAELVALNIEDLKAFVNTKKRDLTDKLRQKAEYQNMLLKNLSTQFKLKSPENKVKLNSQKICQLKTEIDYKIQSKLKDSATELGEVAQLLEAYNPLAILKKGYSLTYKDDKIVRSANEIEVGDTINIRLFDSQMTAKVIERKKSDEI